MRPCATGGGGGSRGGGGACPPLPLGRGIPLVLHPRAFKIQKLGI